MSEKLSKAIIEILLKNGLIVRSEIEIYCYGYETLIYSIEQMMLLIFVGTILRRYWEVLVFTIVFVSLRRYTGGYHAHTRVGCTCITVIMYIVIILMTQITVFNTLTIYVFIFIFFWYAFFKNVPVEHYDKPLSCQQCRRNKRISFIISIFYTIISGCMVLHGIYEETGRMIIWTMFAVSFLVVFKGLDFITLQKG